MKRLLFFFALCLSVAVAQAQSADDIYRDFQDVKNIKAMTVPKAMLHLGSKAVKDNNVQAVLQQVDKVRLLDMSDCSKRKRKSLAKRVEQLSNQGYETITQVKDDNDNVRVYGKEADGKITELVFLVSDDDDATFGIVKGHINKEDLGAIIGVFTDD